MVLLEVLKFYSCQSNYPAVIQDGKNLFWPSNRILCCFDHSYLWSSHGQKECALFQKIPALSEESAGWYITHMFPIWSKKLQFSCIVQNWVNLLQFSNTSCPKLPSLGVTTPPHLAVCIMNSFLAYWINYWIPIYVNIFIEQN